jgi:uncharacterized C2H2 Zn-finger protein
MKKITKKTCPKCSIEISSSNYTRHIDACNGEGTFAQKEILRKQKFSEIKEFVCEHCSKVFNTLSGRNGHVARSHTHNKAKEYGLLGLLKQKQMRESGHIFKGTPHTVEFKEKQSQRMIERLKNKPFWSKRENYKGVLLDSSYELIVARSLDENDVKWRRPSKGLKWFDGKQNRHYLPDFYLIEYDVYLDPKNDFLIKKDRIKIDLTIQQNNVKILVLDKNNLTWDKIKTLL